jgi:hypothetical protein
MISAIKLKDLFYVSVILQQVKKGMGYSLRNFIKMNVIMID